MSMLRKPPAFFCGIVTPTASPREAVCRPNLQPERGSEKQQSRGHGRHGARYPRFCPNSWCGYLRATLCYCRYHPRHFGCRGGLVFVPSPDDDVKGPLVSVTAEKALPLRRMMLQLRARARLLARRQMRDSEIAITAVAALIGALISLGVALTRQAVAEFHHVLFGVPIETHL